MASTSSTKAWVNRDHPILSPALYVFVVLVFAGGSGIWVPAFTPNHKLGVDAVFTFVMAALATLGTEIVLKQSSTVDTQFKRLAFMGGAATTAALALIAFLKEQEYWSINLALFSAFLCVVIWFVVYLGHEMFKEPRAPLKAEPPARTPDNPNDLLGDGVPMVGGPAPIAGSGIPLAPGGIPGGGAP